MPNFPKNPDGMKPSGFKMKGSPHKMGTIQGTSGHASALKQATIESLAQQKLDYEANKYNEAKIKSDEVIADRKKKKEKEAYDLTDEGKAEIKKAKEDAQALADKKTADAKAKVDATRGTERGQKKKSGKLDKIQARQDKKALKKFNKNQRGSYKEYKESVGEGEGKLSKKDWKAQNKANATSMEDFKSSKSYTDKSTRREERLKKEVNMTPEEYKANQATKKQKFKDSMNRLAMTVHPNYDPSEVAAFDESVRTRGQAAETERINNEYKAAETKRIESGLDAYKKKKAETDQLIEDPNFAQVNGGMDNTDTKND